MCCVLRICVIHSNEMCTKVRHDKANNGLILEPHLCFFISMLKPVFLPFFEQETDNLDYSTIYILIKCTWLSVLDKRVALWKQNVTLITLIVCKSVKHGFICVLPLWDLNILFNFSLLLQPLANHLFHLKHHMVSLNVIFFVSFFNDSLTGCLL